MYSVLILLLIAKTAVVNSSANVVEKKYKQSGAKCKLPGIETDIVAPVSLVKCAKLCTTSDSCTAFMRGPGEACSLLETCNTTCTLTDDSAKGWKLYYVDGIVVT